MSKRQIRISGLQLQSRLHEFINKKINLVMLDNTVLFGTLMKADAQMIKLQNMRLKYTHIPVRDVVELYTDVDA